MQFDFLMPPALEWHEEKSINVFFLMNESGVRIRAIPFIFHAGANDRKVDSDENVSEIGRAETAEFILNRQSVLHQCRERFPSPPDPELIITENFL